MKGRIRIAAVGVVAMMVISGLSSTAGASVSNWNVKATGGSVDLTILGDKLEIGGGLTEADASSSNLAEATGTGLCIDANSPTKCATDAKSATYSTTKSAVANGANASDPGGTACLTGAPLNLVIATVGIGCGSASASESNGLPTAEGDGSLLSAALNLTLGSAVPGLSSVANAVSCNSTPAAAATSTGGNDVSQLTGPVQSLLGTVNSLLGALPVPVAPLTNVASPTDPAASQCSVLGGLLSQLGSQTSSLPILGSLTGLLTNLVTNGVANAANTSLLSVTAIKGSSSVANASGTVSSTGQAAGVDVNVLNGMLDLQVVPAVATSSVNLTTGAATATCKPGLISVTVGGGAPNLVDGTPLGSAVQQILQTLYATALQPLLTTLLGAQNQTKVLSCDAPSVSGATSASDSGATAALTLLPGSVLGPNGLLSLSVGAVSAEANSTTATPAVITSPAATPTAATPAAPAAVPAAATVPGVTTVHTGEFWAGTLPIILMSGMGLAGIMLIARRRIFSVARSIAPFTRRGSGH